VTAPAGCQCAAACAPLRAALPNWRGKIVLVNGRPVRLIDWCASSVHLVDLFAAAFPAPLSQGVVGVTVRW
jgi:hypothetical protein